MSTEEWKRFISNWENSKKHKDLKKKKEEKTFMNYDKEQLLAIIEQMSEFHLLDEDTKETIEMLDGNSIYTYYNREELIADYMTTILKWTFHIVMAEQKEDYEFCQALRLPILIEQEDLMRVINKYYPETTEEELVVISTLKELALKEARKQLKNKQ